MNSCRISAVQAVFFGFWWCSAAAFADSVLTNCTPASLAAALQRGGVVTFACDGTITVTNTLIISTNTTLDANGLNVVLSGGEAVRLFEVRPDVLFTIKGVSLRNGRDGTETNGVAGATGRGGAIYNQGRLAIVGGELSSNSAVGSAGADGQSSSSAAGEEGQDGGPAFGGAIFNDGGLLFLTNIVFFGNSASGGAGGDGASGGQFGQGSAGGRGGRGGFGVGGAIFNARGVVEIFDCSFISNHVAGAVGGTGGGGVGVLGFDGQPGQSGVAQGGAVYNQSGAVHVRNSTFAVNTCVGVAGLNGRPGRASLDGEDGADGSGAYGGGVFNENGAVLATNVTFYGNILIGGDGGTGGAGGPDGFGGDGGDGGTGGAADGGGIFSDGGKVEAINGTFSGNLLVPGEGGMRGEGNGITGRPGRAGDQGSGQGASVSNTSGTMIVKNTILGNSGTIGNAAGTITDGGHNLSRDSTPGFSLASSSHNIDPKLGIFANHGGLTPTLILATNSPAIDAGDGTISLPFDQRHAWRNGRTDIGAFEFGGQFAGLILTARQDMPDQFILSWAASVDVVLESTASLSNAAQWTTVTNVPLTIDVLNTVTLPVTQDGAFFRLRPR